jgi:hypothetical protein
MNEVVYPDSVFEVTREKSTELFRGQENVALADTEDSKKMEEKLKDYQKVIATADQPTFLSRDEST